MVIKTIAASSVLIGMYLSDEWTNRMNGFIGIEDSSY
jgi:hypothetical protein